MDIEYHTFDPFLFDVALTRDKPKHVHTGKGYFFWRQGLDSPWQQFEFKQGFEAYDQARAIVIRKGYIYGSALQRYTLKKRTYHNET